MPDDAQSKPTSAQKKHRIRFFIAAAVLVVVVFSIGIAASATDFDLWNVIVQWSSETLGLKFGMDKHSDDKLNPELLELFLAVGYKDDSLIIVPHYLPDGYKQAELYVEDDAIVGKYDNYEGSSIIIQYREIYDNPGGYFQRDRGVSRVKTVEGTDYYISTNLGRYLVAWAVDGWECAIIGVDSEEELLRMIDSIYSEE